MHLGHFPGCRFKSRTIPENPGRMACMPRQSLNLILIVFLGNLLEIFDEMDGININFVVRLIKRLSRTYLRFGRIFMISTPPYNMAKVFLLLLFFFFTRLVLPKFVLFCLFVCSFIYLFFLLIICLFIHLFVHLVIHSVCSFICFIFN